MEPEWASVIAQLPIVDTLQEVYEAYAQALSEIVRADGGAGEGDCGMTEVENLDGGANAHLHYSAALVLKADIDGLTFAGGDNPDMMVLEWDDDDMADWTIQSRPIAPTERKPRENGRTWGNRRACHRTRGGRGCVGRLRRRPMARGPHG